MPGLSTIIIEVEDTLAEFNNALHADVLQRKEQARKAAEALAKQQHLLEEQEAQRIASKHAKCQIYEELAKEYGGDAGSVIHVHIRTYSSLVILTDLPPIL